mmetsp:Transcript_22030/g.53636  ORF Transcript_22030/g.53636 Transcript_22030/m.53636 type:complete len:207 (+) Transcript_22030:998-1618(+)
MLLALLQFRLQLGSLHRVTHLGVSQSRVLRPAQGSGGQNMAQLGSPQSILQPSKALGSLVFGQRVSQDGTAHSGLQFCSHTGFVQFQPQCGTQLFRFSSGTTVGCGVMATAAFSVSGSVPFAAVLFAAVALLPVAFDPLAGAAVSLPAAASAASAPPSAGAAVVVSSAASSGAASPSGSCRRAATWTALATAPWGRCHTLLPRTGL